MRPQSFPSVSQPRIFGSPTLQHASAIPREGFSILAEASPVRREGSATQIFRVGDRSRAVADPPRCLGDCLGWVRNPSGWFAIASTLPPPCSRQGAATLSPSSAGIVTQHLRCHAHGIWSAPNCRHMLSISVGLPSSHLDALVLTRESACTDALMRGFGTSAYDSR